MDQAKNKNIFNQNMQQPHREDAPGLKVNDIGIILKNQDSSPKHSGNFQNQVVNIVSSPNQKITIVNRGVMNIQNDNSMNKQIQEYSQPILL